MKSKYLTLVAAAFLVSACQTGIDTSQRDSGGTTMHLSQWKPIKPHELVINVADLEGIEISNPESRIRDNRILQQRATFDGATGFLRIHHHQVAGYNQHVTRRMNSRENAKTEVNKYFKGQKKKIVHGEARKISSSGRGGWLMSVDVQDIGKTCFLATVGFLGDTNKIAPVGEHYDTIVRFLDCSGKRSMGDVEHFLNGMKIVEPQYNRILLR